MKRENFPQIGEGRFALFRVEASTGITLNTTGSYYLKSKSNKEYQVFESKEEGISFIANQNIKNIEYWLFDSNGILVHEHYVYMGEKEVKPWWKFWQ